MPYMNALETLAELASRAPRAGNQCEGAFVMHRRAVAELEHNRMLASIAWWMAVVCHPSGLGVKLHWEALQRQVNGGMQGPAPAREFEGCGA